MIIILTTGTTYNLEVTDDKRRLMQYIPTLHRRGRENELIQICHTIKAASVIGYPELEIYRKAKNSYVVPIEFAARYYVPNVTEKYGVSNRFTFVKGQCYRLPKAMSTDVLVYALLDKYLYERQRNERDSVVCLNLRRAIDKFIPGAMQQSDYVLKTRLCAHENASGDYYGDCVSDDSDSEAEEAFKALPEGERSKKLERARWGQRHAQSHSYQVSMDGKSKPPQIDFTTRPVIQRDQARAFDRRQANADLNAINDKLQSEGALSSEFLASLTTKFVVAQYRGIHYLTTQWDMIGRRKHRKMDERHQPQYSSAVFASCGVTSYHEYVDRLRSEPGFRERLQTAAYDIFKLLLLMQHSDPVSWDGFAYVSLFHLLQYWYSLDYSGLPKKLADDFAKEASVFKPFLRNTHRPLLSTADIPYHALKYAYGIKLYEEYRGERLEPRWRKDGRAERPYSGKVYVSLHPLNDYTERNPSHITSMFTQGLLQLSNIVAPERETSFLGYLPEDRVTLQYIAKYPSFKGEYKTLYEDKYGISKSMYEKLQRGFQAFPPHSEERKNLELVLAEYLCAYHEVRLIQEAQEAAEKGGAVLVYRDENGKFGLYHPKTPSTASKCLRSVVMAKRHLYKALGSNKGKRITVITKEYMVEALDRELPYDEHPEKYTTEWMRFFGHKHTFKEGEKIIPVKTLTG